MASPACSVCQRIDLAEIDVALASGSSIVPTAARFDVSKSALGRHKLNCLAPKLAAAARIVAPVAHSKQAVKRARAIATGEAASPAEILSLTALVSKLSRSIDRLEDAAQCAGDTKAFNQLAALSGQIHRGIEAAAKLQGLGGLNTMETERFSITIVLPTI